MLPLLSRNRNKPGVVPSRTRGAETQPQGDRPAPNNTGRSNLIDIAKGLAIALVALGHTNQGELARGYWGASLVGVHLNAFIYAFHMPAFFFLSGIFLRRSLATRGLRGFVAQKARTLLYPFVLWSLLIPLLTALLATVFVLRPLHVRDVLLNLVTGNTAWFLPALFVALLFAALLRSVPFAVLLPLTCAIALFWHPSHILAVDRGLWHLPFVVAGMALGTHVLRLDYLPVLPCLVASGVLAAGLSLAVQHFTSAAVIRWLLLPAGFYGTAMLLLFAHALSGRSWARWTAQVGQASLWIFLLAPFPQGFIRVVLVHLGCIQPVTQLLLPTLAAIVLPTLFYQYRDLLHLNRMFALPEPLTVSWSGHNRERPSPARPHEDLQGPISDSSASQIRAIPIGVPPKLDE